MSSQLRASQASKHTQPAAPSRVERTPLYVTVTRNGVEASFKTTAYPTLAHFIRAVNEREELIACLRELVKIGQTLPQPATHDGLALADGLARARAQLAKVEGE